MLCICPIFLHASEQDIQDSIPKKWIDINPVFYEKKHSLKIIGAIDFYEKGFTNLGALGLHYSQPNTFFRLPARMVLELEGFIGSKTEQSLNQLIFGVAEDIVLSIPHTNFYAGVGIGIYIRTLLDSRMNSAFTFGEKMFIGYTHAIANQGLLSCEVFVKHYSNGDLTPINKGFNFFGMSVGYTF